MSFVLVTGKKGRKLWLFKQSLIEVILSDTEIHPVEKSEAFYNVDSIG